MADDEQLQAEPSPPYSDMLLEFHRFLSHFRRSSFRQPHGGRGPPVMEGIVQDGILTWYINGQLVSDGGSSGFGGVPASEEAIAALPETTIGDGETPGECAVCLQDYQAGDTLRTMPCSHGFHDRCILPWLRVSHLCPLCRFALPPPAESLADD